MAALLFFLLGSLALSLRLIYQCLDPGLQQFPGPFMARFTNLWRLQSIYRNRHELALRRLHKKYGMAVRIGPNAVSISDPEAIDSIYGFKNELAKSGFYSVMERYKNGRKIPTLVSLKEKKDHTRLKRPVATAYSMTSLTQFEPYLDDMIRVLINQLNSRFISPGDTGPRHCDIDNWLLYYAFDVIALLSLGKPFGLMEQGCDKNGLIKEVELETTYVALVGQIPTLDLLFRKNPLVTALMNVTSPFALTVRGLLFERLSDKKVGDRTDRRDFVSYLQEYQKDNPGKLSDIDIFGHIATNLVAGAETFSIALRSVIYFVLRSPTTVARLQQELDSAQIGYPASWSTTQGGKLPYLEAIIWETLRIQHPGAILSERVVGESGLTLPDGRQLPSGTIVGMNAWTVQDSEIFGVETEQFKPERWLRGVSEPEDEYRARVQRMHRTSLAFGHGSRACIGRNIGTMQMHKVVATLFGLFDIELVDPAIEWKVCSRFLVRQTNMDMRFRWRKNVDVLGFARA